MDKLREMMGEKVCLWVGGGETEQGSVTGDESRMIGTDCNLLLTILGIEE